MKKQHSKYRGVVWHRAKKRWMAECRDPHGKLHCRYLRSQVEAARAYDAMALEYHKGNAILNFPKDRR